MDKEENFLGRWLNDDITEEERTAFENTDDFLAFKDILKATENLDRPTFDVDKNFKKQLEYNKTYTQKVEKKVIRFRPWLYSAAAVVLVLFGLQFFFFSTTEISTGIGQTKSVTLPDSSVVVLNAVSSIAYNKRKFKETRTLQLKGEAYFKVAKGSTFSVSTPQGEVTVLGTEFNVYDRTQSFQVNCYEGKVAVTVKDQKEVITAGQGVAADKDTAMERIEVSAKEPSWMLGRSNFKDIPLEMLIKELQIQYDIRIIVKDVDLTRSYSGFFVHNDIEQALRTSFEPMNISYTFVSQKVVEISNK